MKRRLSNYFYLGSNYKAEFRKQMRLIIVFTLGFTIAFSWRETIFDLSKSFVQWISGIKNANSSSIWASVFITIVSLLLIFLTAKWLKEN
jgi:hypothetical protein